MIYLLFPLYHLYPLVHVSLYFYFFLDSFCNPSLGPTSTTFTNLFFFSLLSLILPFSWWEHEEYKRRLHFVRKKNNLFARSLGGKCLNTTTSFFKLCTRKECINILSKRKYVVSKDLYFTSLTNYINSSLFVSYPSFTDQMIDESEG